MVAKVKVRKWLLPAEGGGWRVLCNSQGLHQAGDNDSRLFEFSLVKKNQKTKKEEFSNALTSLSRVLLLTDSSLTSL